MAGFGDGGCVKRVSRPGLAAGSGACSWTPAERLREPEDTFRGKIPSLWEKLAGMDIALHAHFRAALSEGQQPALWWIGVRADHVVARQGGGIEKMRAPFGFDVRPPPNGRIGTGVSMATEPEIDCSGMIGEKIFKGAGIRLAVNEVKIMLL